MSDYRYDTGLVIGKFYPPHLGHSYLIDIAQSQARRVTAIVCDAAGQSIPGQLRAAWLREMYPDIDVLRIDDVYPADDSRLWAALTRRWLGGAPNAVFTSEDYGEPYARFLGSVHVSVDPPRRIVPCRARDIRADPWSWWDYIAPPVRAYYCKRIRIVGAESTGKTTLAPALAAHYNTLWVPEYGREYCARRARGGHDRPWSTEEFIHIAREQGRREDEAARQANRILICDTDAFATGIWHERYMQSPSPSVAAASPPALYLVTDVNVPFVQDGTRDGEHIRHWMHERFIDALTAAGYPFTVVSGDHDARLRQSISAIDSYRAGLSGLLFRPDGSGRTRLRRGRLRAPG